MVVISDRISDFIIRIKNAGRISHKDVMVPHSNLIEKIAEKLQKTDFIGEIKILGDKVSNKRIIVKLKYSEKGKHRIQEVKRISKPSKRVYIKAKEITTVKSNTGAIFISTPKGILTGREAKKEQVGGEALFMIW